MAAPDFSIGLLGSGHDRAVFDCGVPALNTYLRNYARQDMDRGIAAAYVLVPSNNPTEIAGFYTLAATAIKLTDFPEETAKKNCVSSSP